mmetsp:Transcript_115276/g.229701  ORF Transcript_115276/g.229701 Transcript_115276/m.229701 type:complete len:154 (+) Transcript_115276:81-542(+)
MLTSWCLLVLFSGTSASSPNASHPPHKATCRGGKVAACRCMLSCEVFGGEESAAQCGTLPKADKVVHHAIQKALNSRGPDDGTITECDGIKCIVACAKRQGCLSHLIKGKCLTIQRDDATCDVDCNSSQRITGTSAVQQILVAVLLMAAQLRL